MLSAGQDPDTPATHPLDVSAWTEAAADGPRLTVRLSWPAGLLAEPAAARLAEGYRQALLALAGLDDDPAAGGLTPPTSPWSSWTRTRSTSSKPTGATCDGHQGTRRRPAADTAAGGMFFHAGLAGRRTPTSTPCSVCWACPARSSRTGCGRR
ncbi:hypothetical protein GXW82_13990 [Streptacidiphilus sp. 4-A2]|nr:hypothetical protein [Streptacidiphilus sp. 4-A2]